MNVLFVPSLGLDTSLIERLAASIDFDVKWKVVLNNGPTGALESFRNAHPDWIVKEPSVGNRGVAGSWNDCSDWFSSEPAWLIMNEDAWFLPGQLEQICRCADENLNEPIIYLNETQAFYCFVWTLAGREQFGRFDENFWPAYYEDCDYRVRLRLGGKRDYIYALSDGSVVPHGKPRTGGDNYAGMINGCGLLSRAYWLRKWGSLNFEEATYQTPYKDHRLTIKDWVWYPEERAKRFPLYDAFMSLNPSIYE